jgi:hypothetical protein
LTFFPLNENADVRAATRNASILASAFSISSASQSQKYSFSGSALMLTNGSTAMEGERLGGGCGCESCAATLFRSLSKAIADE